MAGNYSRFGTSSPERIRSLIMGAGPDQDLTTSGSEGIMSRAPQPTGQVRSRFSGVSGPVALTESSPTETGNSFLENFFIMLGRSADDPENVASAVAPMKGDPAVDLGEWENMPPAPGSQSSTRQALGTAPRSSSTRSESGTFNLDIALNEVLENEGGFQQLRQDRGNYVNGRLIGTNFGVTPKALAEYRGVDPKSITVEDIRNLEEDEARDIFLDNYYFKPGLDRLPQDLQANVFDMYVNSGRNAISILQDLAGVERDGVLGPDTIEALRNTNITNEMYANRRIEYYNSVARNNPSQRGFLQGWLNRARKYL